MMETLKSGSRGLLVECEESTQIFSDQKHLALNKTSDRVAQVSRMPGHSLGELLWSELMLSPELGSMTFKTPSNPVHLGSLVRAEPLGKAALRPNGF